MVKYTLTDVENIKKRASELGLNLDAGLVSRLNAGAIQTPPQTPTPPPTVSNQTPADIDSAVYQGETPEEKAIRDAEEKAQSIYPTETPDAEKIRTDTLARFQSEIDALNVAAAQKKAELASTLGEKAKGQLGTQRALLAGSGMLGQVSGAAQKSNLETAQAQELKAGQEAIDALYAEKIAALRGQARDEASKELEAKQKAYAEGATSLVDYLKNKQTRKTTSINSVVKTALLNGIDLSSPDAVAELAKTMGVSAQSIIDAYKTGKSDYDTQQAEAQAKVDKEAAELAKTQAETYKLQHPEANVKEVGGGLYDVTNNKWLVNPTLKDTFELDKNGNVFNKTKGIYEATGTSNVPSASKNTEVYQNTINSIDEITNSSNINTVKQLASTNPFAHFDVWENFSGDRKNQIAAIEQLISQEALNSLIAAKAKGATFGALSDREMDILTSAATKLGTWRVKDRNRKVIGYDIDPEHFIEELNKMKTSAAKLKQYAEAEAGQSATTSTQYPDYEVNGVIYKADENGNYSPQ